MNRIIKNELFHGGEVPTCSRHLTCLLVKDRLELEELVRRSSKNHCRNLNDECLQKFNPFHFTERGQWCFKIWNEPTFFIWTIVLAATTYIFVAIEIFRKIIIYELAPSVNEPARSKPQTPLPSDNYTGLEQEFSKLYLGQGGGGAGLNSSVDSRLLPHISPKSADSVIITNYDGTIE